MQNELGFDPAVLLLLLGMYFVVNYNTSKSILELLYGLTIVCYYFKYIYIRRKNRIKNGIKH